AVVRALLLEARVVRAAGIAVLAREHLPRVEEGARLGGSGIAADVHREIRPRVREEAPGEHHRAGVLGADGLLERIDLRVRERGGAPLAGPALLPDLLLDFRRLGLRVARRRGRGEELVEIRLRDGDALEPRAMVHGGRVEGGDALVALRIVRREGGEEFLAALLNGSCIGLPAVRTIG